MSITNVMLEAFMQLSSAKQEVYATNIANVNKPGYLAQGITSPNNFAEVLKSTSARSQVNLVVTSNNHISGSKPNIKFKTIIDPDGGELKPNGNNVSLADQAKKAAQNQMLFETALRAYKSSSGLVKTVVSKGR